MTFSMSEDTQGVRLITPENPITLQPDTTWKINVIYTWDMPQPHLVVSWDEDGEQKEETFDVQ